MPNVNIGKLLSVREQSRTEFGQRLFDARVDAGLSQPDVKKALGLSQSTLSELEWKGQGSSHVVALANLYKVYPAWLASGKGPRKLSVVAQAAVENRDEPSPSEWAHLHEFREASKSDKEKIEALAAEAAEKMRALRREVMERMGLPAEAPPDAGNYLPSAPRDGRAAPKEKKNVPFDLAGKAAKTTNKKASGP